MATDTKAGFKQILILTKIEIETIPSLLGRDKAPVVMHWEAFLGEGGLQKWMHKVYARCVYLLQQRRIIVIMLTSKALCGLSCVLE